MDINNSIIPLIDWAEKIEHLDSNKYTKHQYAAICHALKNVQNKIRIVTYNMLYNIQDDDLDEFDRWPLRRPRLVKLIQWMNADIICSQELHRVQLDELMKEIGETYQVYGKENKDKGEIDCILFKPERFDLLESKIWKIQPNIPLAYPHTLVKILFKDRKTGKQFIVFNTHLPYFSPDQREFSINFIKEKLQEAADRFPVIFAGDFNTIPQRLDIQNLPFLDGDYLLQQLDQGPLINTLNTALLGHLGPLGSFTTSPDSNDGKSFKGSGVPGIVLDHIYANRQATILVHAIEPAKIDQHFPSDHMPVIVDFLV